MSASPAWRTFWFDTPYGVIDVRSTQESFARSHLASKGIDRGSRLMDVTD